MVANGSGAWSYTTAALASGAHSFTATATDAAGNTGAASSALAVTVTSPAGAPAITSFSPDTGVIGDGITDPAILTLTGTAVANSTVKIYDGTTLLGSTTANASGAWSYTTVPLPDGPHSLTATDTVAGVTSTPSAVMNVLIDTVAPVAPSIAVFSTDSGKVGDHITNDATLTLTGTAEANSRSRSPTARRCWAALWPTAAGPGAIRRRRSRTAPTISPRRRAMPRPTPVLPLQR